MNEIIYLKCYVSLHKGGQLPSTFTEYAKREAYYIYICLLRSVADKCRTSGDTPAKSSIPDVMRDMSQSCSQADLVNNNSSFY